MRREDIGREVYREKKILRFMKGGKTLKGKNIERKYIEKEN